MAKQQAQNYKFEYLSRGSAYSSQIDFRRFVTLDYNLESYLGVVGVGIISGWEIEEKSGLTVKILPGKGIIDGFVSESDYTFELRSDMVIGDREIEEVHDFIDQKTYAPIVYDNLDPTQYTNYVAVIQDYDPTYVPPETIENCYVKVVVPYEITLSDNSETFIVAIRPTDATPYPIAADFPTSTLIRPKDGDYATYSAFKAAMDAYNSQIAIIRTYEWRTNPANHFTAVEFDTRSSYTNSTNKILLGKVITRSGSVIKIDTSKVENLMNMESAIKQAAKALLPTHTHGGTKYFDPAKIKLETDIRKSFLREFNAGTGVAIFDVSEMNYTSIINGHKHNYKLDANSNGFTIEVIGSGAFHFHKIVSGVIQTQEASYLTVEDHIHSYPEDVTVGGWTTDSSFTVYVNDVIFGNNTSTSLEADSTNKTLKLFNAFGAKYRSYSSTFDITVNGVVETFSFSSREYSVFKFMSNMISEFNKKYGFDSVGKNSDGSLDVSSNPFLFVSDTDNTVLSGFSELYDQSEIAQYALKSVGDSFVFTPKAAQNITVSLTETDSITVPYNVKIEILGNTEVTGILGLDNILFVNANKIQTGEIEVVNIPFISHIGRMKEEILPFKYPLVSENGIQYMVTPAITKNQEGHYHGLFLDSKGGGVTNQTFIGVGETPVYYASGPNDTSYLIEHIHGVTEGNVHSATSTGVMDWQNYVNGSNSTTSTHTHEIIYPIVGDPHIVYSLKEMADGAIFAGTSTGLMVVPAPTDIAYLFVMNGIPIYQIGNDLWDMLESAKISYQQVTGTPFIVTEDIYLAQVTEAESELVSHGDSFMLYGADNTSDNQDKIMVKKLDYFETPNLTAITEKSLSDYIGTDEVVIGKKFVDNTTGEELTEIEASAVALKKGADAITETLIVQKDLNSMSVWSLELKEDSGAETILALGATALASATDVTSNFYQSWESPTKPLYTGSLKKAFRDSNNDVWVVTNSGMLVSRDYQSRKMLEPAGQPGIDPNVFDICEGETGTVYCACNGGIFKTLDGGYIWTSSFSHTKGCNQIIRDFAIDKTNTVSGHYHTLSVNSLGNGISSVSIGAGVAHTHIISSWTFATTLAHTHTLIVSLYAVTKDNKIYQSTDNGVAWSLVASKPADGFELFVFNSILAVNKNDGLYILQGNSWFRSFDEIVYSFALRYDLGEVLVGCYNKIYSTFDFLSFSLEEEFSSKPDVTLYKNDSAQKLGYAYNSKRNSFLFKDLLYVTDPSFALVDFQKWKADRGAWSENSKYDIYIDEDLVLSTQKGIDRRSDLGYGFNIYPNEGILDFGAATSIIETININDDAVSVSNSYGFVVGDKILIQSEVVDSNHSTSISSGTFYSNVAGIVLNSTIVNIDGTIIEASGQIILSEKSDKEIKIPATMSRIPNVDSSTVIKISVYESPLTNSGTLSHEEIENKLSAVSDGRPYEFNNTFLGNLLQLTQAIRYVYPTIDSTFKNSKFYDFHYSWNVTDPNYIGNEVDLFESDIYNFSIFTNIFFNKGAKKVNKILFGTGNFAGNLIIGTDIGIFWAKVANGLEGNWFYVNSISSVVNDLIIFGDNLLACTEDGTYSTTDMVTWTLQEDPPIFFPSTKVSFRWKGRSTVSVPSHTATFANGYGLDANVGSIVSASNVYGSLIENRKIKVQNAGGIDGIYTIKNLLSTNHIITYELFPVAGLGSHSGVTIDMGAWWEYFNGDTNTNNANLTNTLMVGGHNKIAYCTNSKSVVWSESFVPNEIKDFNVSSFCPVENGVFRASTVSTSNENAVNYILENNNIGNKWSIFKSFEQTTGQIISSSVTEFSHTKMKVSFNNHSIYEEGDLCKGRISVFPPNGTTAIYTGDVIWNENRADDFIYVYGQELHSLFAENGNLNFIVYPVKINSMVQLEGLNDLTVLYGTDRGIYSDLKSSNSVAKFKGTVMEIGLSRIVSQIDTFGTIKSVSKGVSGNVQFSVLVNNNTPSNSLVGNILYVTDLEVVGKYIIVKNGSRLVSGEILIEVEKTYSDTFLEYSGKKVTISNMGFSRIYIPLGINATPNQYKNGHAYVISFNGNIGKSYTIIGSTQEYIDVSGEIIPVSTLSSVAYLKDSDVRTGQSLSLMDATNRLDLYVEYDFSVITNQLAGMNISFSNFYGSSAADVENITVYSNDRNRLTLNPLTSILVPPLAFHIGDRFSANGFVFEPLAKFNNKKTSVESDHYHDVTTVGSPITGQIAAFTNINDSFVDIVVSNTVGFNTSLVQASGDLFRNGKITFYNANHNTYWYVSEIYSHTPTSIRVYIQDPLRWDFVTPSADNVSVGWSWEIDSANYGYTQNIYYKDFAVYETLITDTVSSGQNTVYVDSSSGITVGDKIQLVDENMKTETKFVSTITSPTEIKLSTNLIQSFYKVNVPFVKVVKDSFTNNHTHQIRNCQLQTLLISDYLDLGYPSLHSHESFAFLPSVAKIIENSGNIIAVGASESVFISYNREDWKELTNLNETFESHSSVTGIVDIETGDDGKLVASTDNGYLATQTPSTAIVPLEKPTIT